MDICYQCGSETHAQSVCCAQCGMAVLPVDAATPAAPAAPAAGDTMTDQTVGADRAPVTGTPPGPNPVTLTAPYSVAIGRPMAPGGTGLRRLRLRTVIALGAVLAVLAGGGAAAYVRTRPATAESTVKQYFDELADGDTAAALRLVSAASEYPQESYPLLASKALSDSADRPRDLRIIGTNSSTAATREVTSVQVSYKVRDATVTQSILAIKEVDDGPAYLLHRPFLELGVTSLAGRRLTVNGIAADLSDEDATYVFPGAYTATAQGNPLVADAAQPAVTQSSDIGDQPVAVIDFGAPTLAPGARQTVQTMVRQRIDACAQSTSSEPENCPFSVFLFGSDASVKWTITAYPTVTVDLSSAPSEDEQAVISSTAYDGVAHYVATVTDPFGGGTKTETGDARFGVRGTATGSQGQITVSLD